MGMWVWAAGFSRRTGLLQYPLLVPKHPNSKLRSIKGSGTTHLTIEVMQHVENSTPASCDRRLSTVRGTKIIVQNSLPAQCVNAQETYTNFVFGLLAQPQDTLLCIFNIPHILKKKSQIRTISGLGHFR